MNWLSYAVPVLWIAVASLTLFYLITNKNQPQKIFYQHLPIAYGLLLSQLFLMLQPLILLPTEIIANGTDLLTALLTYYVLFSSIYGVVIGFKNKQWWLLASSFIQPLILGILLVAQKTPELFNWIEKIQLVQQPTSVLVLVVAGAAIVIKKRKAKKQSEITEEQTPSL